MYTKFLVMIAINHILVKQVENSQSELTTIKVLAKIIQKNSAVAIHFRTSHSINFDKHSIKRRESNEFRRKNCGDYYE